MRLRPKYTRAKEEGRRIQQSGSLISPFFMRCRSRRLVLTAGDDLFHQFHVLNTLLGSIHGFLHQPVALDADTTREKPSSSAGFRPISSAGRSATDKALQLMLSNSAPRPTLLVT